MLQDALEAATRARSLGTVEMFRAGQVAFAARNTASITASLVKFGAHSINFLAAWATASAAV